MIKFNAYILFSAALLTLLIAERGAAESARLNEYEVKTAYLYNFAKYVEWPATPRNLDNAPIFFCISRKSPLSSFMVSLVNKTIKNHAVSVRIIDRVEEIGPCNLLFIDGALQTALPQIIPIAAGQSILTVSDMKGFTAAGGMIQLIAVDSKIRFQINNRAVLRANMKISSHLLRLAASVQE